MEDNFTIANKNFSSRLIVGTGKYKSFESSLLNSAIEVNNMLIQKLCMTIHGLVKKLQHR